VDTDASIRRIVSGQPFDLGAYSRINIFRVTKRLGWIPPNTTYEKAHQLLGALIPPKIYSRLHLDLIRHGREICVAGVPRFEICPLKDVCEYYAKIQGVIEGEKTRIR
jgi:adenine-specific DNA glycosylase